MKKITLIVFSFALQAPVYSMEEPVTPPPAQHNDAAPYRTPPDAPKRPRRSLVLSSIKMTGLKRSFHRAFDEIRSNNNENEDPRS